MELHLALKIGDGPAGLIALAIIVAGAVWIAIVALCRPRSQGAGTEVELSLRTGGTRDSQARLNSKPGSTP